MKDYRSIFNSRLTIIMLHISNRIFSILRGKLLFYDPKNVDLYMIGNEILLRSREISLGDGYEEI